MAGVEQLAPEFRPDVLEMDESFGSAGLVAQQLPMPVIVRLHGPYFLNGVAMGVPRDKAFYHRSEDERQTILKAVGLTAPSMDLLERVRREYGKKLPYAEVIPNSAPDVPEVNRWRRENTDRNFACAGTGVG